MAIITFSRQVGSFGDEIATLVAEKLGYELITKDYIHNLAQECDKEFESACKAFEEEAKPRRLLERLSVSNPSYKALFESLNYELASRGNVILLGRGAQMVLSGIPGVIKCRVVAPAEIRARRIAKKMNLTPDQALRYVEDRGRQRRSLIETVFGKSLSDWSLYDLVINTALLSIQAAAKLICLAAEEVRATIDFEERRLLLENLAKAKRIESVIKKHVTLITPWELTVEVAAGGKVTLSGVVADRRSKERAGTIAAESEGVSEVTNNLGVTQLSF